jgi:hypothetical protein
LEGNIPQTSKPISDLMSNFQVHICVPAIGGQPLHPVGRLCAFIVRVEPPPLIIAGLAIIAKTFRRHLNRYKHFFLMFETALLVARCSRRAYPPYIYIELRSEARVQLRRFVFDCFLCFHLLFGKRALLTSRELGGSLTVRAVTA